MNHGFEVVQDTSLVDVLVIHDVTGCHHVHAVVDQTHSCFAALVPEIWVDSAASVLSPLTWLPRFPQLGHSASLMGQAGC